MAAKFRFAGPTANLNLGSASGSAPPAPAPAPGGGNNRGVPTSAKAVGSPSDLQRDPGGQRKSVNAALKPVAKVMAEGGGGACVTGSAPALRRFAPGGVVGPFTPTPSTSTFNASRSVPSKRPSPKHQIEILSSDDDEKSTFLDGVDENIAPVPATLKPASKRPRISTDSGFGESSTMRIGNNDETMVDQEQGEEVHQDLEIPDSETEFEEDEHGLEFAGLRGLGRSSTEDAMEAIERAAAAAAAAEPAKKTTWMPAPAVSTHLDEQQIDELQNTLADYQDRRVNIADQLSEIYKNGGGRSSEGNDAGFLEHNKVYIDDRIQELKAEILNRKGITAPPAVRPAVPGSSTPRSAARVPPAASMPRAPSYQSSESSKSSTLRSPGHSSIPAAAFRPASAAVTSGSRSKARAPPPKLLPSSSSSASSEPMEKPQPIAATYAPAAAVKPTTGFRSASGLPAPPQQANRVASGSTTTLSSASRAPFPPPPVPAPAPVPKAFAPAPTAINNNNGKGKGRAVETLDITSDDLYDGINFDDVDIDPTFNAHRAPPLVQTQLQAKQRQTRATYLTIDEEEDDDEVVVRSKTARRPFDGGTPQQATSRFAPASLQPSEVSQPRAAGPSTLAARSAPPPPVPKQSNALPPVVKAKHSHPWSRDVDKALRQRFGLVGFRTHQQEAVDATLSGKDVFVLLPTGGGKSLCYQLPAVVQTGKTRGVTVVISPLLSLIEDQCKALAEKDVPVVSVSSKMPAADRDHAHACLRASPPGCDMVYLTPEQIVNSNVMKGMLRALYNRNQLARFVLDEAHCVSSWGHDFRPDYKAMSCLKEEYPGVPLMALTATASKRVVKDIMDNLRMKSPLVLTASFNRPNLRYEVRPKSKAILKEIVEFISTKHNGECGIIYCFSQKQCEETAMKLRNEKVNARHYHAGMSGPDRSRIQTGWQTNEFQVICATIAFGMGIDKPDVRYVIHYSLPKNLEGYYQETGRAGRDGKSSVCLLFYSYADTAPLYKHIDAGEGSRDQKEHNKESLRLVVQYCVNLTDCRRQQVLRYFNENFDPSGCHKSCDNCLHRGTVARNDVSDLAQTAIRLIQSFPEGARVTLMMAVDVFRGSKSRPIVEKGWDKLPLAGGAAKTNRNDVERLFQILSGQGVLGERLEGNSLGFTNSYVCLGDKAQSVLSGKLPIFMDVADRGTAAASTSTTAAKRKQKPGIPAPVAAATAQWDDDDDDEFDDISSDTWDPLARRPPPPTYVKPVQPGGPSLEELAFEDLSNCRNEIAIEQDCEPHQVVSDAALQTLALVLPTTFSAYLEVEECDEDSYDVFYARGGAKKIAQAYAAARQNGGKGVPHPAQKAPAAPSSSRPPGQSTSKSTSKAPSAARPPARPAAAAISSKTTTSKAGPSTVAKPPARAAHRKFAGKGSRPSSASKASPKKVAAKALATGGARSQADLSRFMFQGADTQGAKSKAKGGSGIKAMKVTKR